LINSNMITAVRKSSVKGFIYVGTVCSFPAHLQSSVDARPLREVDQYPAYPESAYGWSKLMGEYETNLLEKETGILTCIPTLHNVYGAPCDFGEEKSQVIPSLIRKAIRYPEEPFVVWGSGEQGRAFVHVDDVVNALVLSLQKGLGKGLIQIGPDKCTSIKEIAETIIAISGKDIEIIYDTSKPEGDKGRRADYSKAQEVLNWKPRIFLKEGLRKLYNWVEDKIS
jgi:GDP-D-mannose 3',5'-epimerase